MKAVFFHNEARERLRKGIDLICDSIKVTLGPRGRNVIYNFHYGYAIATKDGVTVARQVDANDPIEQLGLLLIRQAAQKTADDVGDGTTTVTLLAQQIYHEGLKAMSGGANPILIKRGIDKAVQEVLTYIDTVIKIDIRGEEDIVNVASLSANNDKDIGVLISNAIKQVGEDGVITIDDNHQNSETYIETMEGMQIHEGLQSMFFSTDRIRLEAIHQNPYIIIIDDDIYSLNQIAKIVDEAIKTGHPVCLMANNFHDSVLKALIQSTIQNSLPLMVVKSPYFGNIRTEQLIDIAILTGGTVIGNASGLRMEDASLKDLGQCERIKSNRYQTTFIKGNGFPDIIQGRIQSIREQIIKSESDYDKQKLQERLAKLTTGVAVIKVGAPTEIEQKEKKMRVEDALLATKAAIQGGVVPGGGFTFYRAIESIVEKGEEEELIGRRILKRILRAPVYQIAANSGMDGAEIVAKLTDNIQHGYDFLSNSYVDLLDRGIIDPAQVVKTALINAASVAGMLLTAEVACAENTEPESTMTPKPRSM